MVDWSVAQGLRDHFVFSTSVPTSRPILGESPVTRDSGIYSGFIPARGCPKICYASGGLSQNERVVERHAARGAHPYRGTVHHGASPSVCLRDGFIVPDLTRTKHRVYSTSEAPSGSDASDLPAETLPDEFVRLR